MHPKWQMLLMQNLLLRVYHDPVAFTALLRLVSTHTDNVRRGEKSARCDNLVDVVSGRWRKLIALMVRV